MDQLVRILRGGAVKRFHTAVLLKEQDVASHSWGVAVILLDVHPDAPARLLRAALYHDVAESIIGDMPATTKWAYPELAASLEKAEADAEEELGIQCTDLTEEEYKILKFCDMAELVLHVAREVRLGNRDAIEIVRRGLIFLEERLWPRRCMDYLPTFKRHVQEMTS